MGLYRNIRGFIRGIGGQHFGHIGLSAGIATVFVEGQGLFHHQLSGAHICIGLGNGKLYALVLPNRAIKDLAIFGIGHRVFDKPFRIANTFRGDQNAFCIHA